MKRVFLTNCYVLQIELQWMFSCHPISLSLQTSYWYRSHSDFRVDGRLDQSMIWDIKEKFGTGKVLEWVVGSESVVVGYGLSLVPVAENLLSEKSLHKILSHSDFLVLK